MIFAPDALLQLAAHLAAKQAIPLPLTRETMGAIVDDAERFAAGNERDEPAAIFHACALRAPPPPKARAGCEQGGGSMRRVALIP